MATGFKTMMLFLCNPVEEFTIAAPFLMVLDYPSQGDAVVNENSYRLLKQYAQRGELYTRTLREHLLAISNVTERVCIMALTITERQVFGSDEIMVAALVRELINDMVLMKSSLGAERKIDDTNILEDDAYYSTFYLQTEYTATNNVRWGSGVAMFGVGLEPYGFRNQKLIALM